MTPSFKGCALFTVLARSGEGSEAGFEAATGTAAASGDVGVDSEVGTVSVSATGSGAGLQV